MNMTQAESARFVESLLLDLGDISDVEVVIIPPFTAIAKVTESLSKAQNIKVGAQNMHWEQCGAFTGEISATMLRPVGSDRRFEAKIGQDEREKMRAGWNQALGRSKAWSA